MKYVIHYTTRDGEAGSTNAFSEEIKDALVWWMEADQGRTITSVEEE